ncbi:MAG: hypothetical protein EXR75_02385 [Myxococcales bacterium]|nr:hypothetical protein [Myxococcales bacterium]
MSSPMNYPMNQLPRFVQIATLGAALAGCDPEAVDEHCSPKSGTICTVAGVEHAGFSGDGGPAFDAALYLPQDMTVGPDGNVYLLDWNNHRVRRVRASDGVIETVAGTGLLGDGPPGPALKADFNHPTNVIFDSDGKMIIAAWHNSRIKVVDLESGELIDTCGTGARAYKGDLGPAKDAALDLPASVALDADDNLFIMDQANQVIRKVSADGTITRVAGSCIVNACADGEVPEACPETNKSACHLATDPTVCAKPCQPGFAGDGGDALLMRMAQPFGQQADPAGRLVVDADGSITFADTENHRVRRIDGKTGIVETIAGSGKHGYSGDGGPATEADLYRPIDVALGDDGTVYFTDTFNSCVRAITNGIITTAAGRCGERGFSGDGASPTSAALDRPYGVALAPNGDLYIADSYNHRVRVVAR